MEFLVLSFPLVGLLGITGVICGIFSIQTKSVGSLGNKIFVGIGILLGTIATGVIAVGLLSISSTTQLLQDVK